MVLFILPLSALKSLFMHVRVVWFHRIPQGLKLAGPSGSQLVRPLLTQGHPEPLAQDNIWMTFKYLYPSSG